MQSSRRTTSTTDLIIEILIPVFIIGLIWSLVVFAITIKGVFYPGHEGTLRKVFFLYVMGTVMINRLAGLYGESEKAGVYSVLLAGVMGLFALTFSARYGALIGGSNAGEGLLANLAIVAVIGIASYAISREACFDITDTTEKKSEIQLKAELKAQQDWYRRMMEEEEQERKEAAKDEETPPRPGRLPRKHPGISIIYFSLFSMVVFAAGQRLLPQDSGELYVRAFNCLLANLVCALVLLFLTTLSALRFYCWKKKTVVPAGVGVFCTLTGGLFIVLVVSLSSLPPRPVPRYLVQSASSDVDSIIPDEDVEEGEQSKSLNTWGGLSKQIEMKLEKEEKDRRKMQEEMAGADQEKDEADPDEGGAGSDGDKGDADAGGGDYDKDADKGAGSGSEKDTDTSSRDRADPDKGSSSKRSRETSSSQTAGQRTIARDAPLPTPPLQGLQTLGKIVFMVLFILGLLWAAVTVLIALGKANPLTKLSSGLRGLRGRLRQLLKRRKRPRFSGEKLQAALREEDLYMENPFRSKLLLNQMSKAELVSYTYKAFENYAYIQGHAPETGQTPIEFVNSLPEEFQAPEFSTLLKLFMLAEYSVHEISDKNIKKLQHVWTKIEP